MRKQIVDVEESMQGYYLVSLMKGCTIQGQGVELPIELLPEEKIVLVGLSIPVPKNGPPLGFPWLPRSPQASRLKIFLRHHISGLQKGH